MPAHPETQPRKLYKRTYLREWRELAGPTGEAFAAAIGYDKTHVSNVERGKRPYTQEFLEKAVEELRKIIPNLAVADVLAIDPSDPASARLVDLARRVPEHKREVAADMLGALAVPLGPEVKSSEDAPRRRPITRNQEKL